MENTHMQINLDDNNIKMNKITFQKMTLIFNAIHDGWSVKRKEDSLVFSKKHENKKEIYLDTFLSKFIHNNADFSKLLS
jgi:hypothetical protein